MAKKAAETVVLVIDDEGIDSLISELIQGSGDSKVCPAKFNLLVLNPESCFSCVEPIVIFNLSGSQVSIRRSASYLIGHLFENSKLYLDDEAPSVISTLIILLSDSDHDTVVVVFADTLLICFDFSIP